MARGAVRPHAERQRGSGRTSRLVVLNASGNLGAGRWGIEEAFDWAKRMKTGHGRRGPSVDGQRQQ